ncbi:MAG: hypothetical protein A4E32_00427 [Methanomassiliicoccales archaeon PtaU1.Bin124]|nr:MAG: hypothetical protein A4E32_00427 [Methanomassiliicoccales archaeon PtaU1.Bin124]
MEYDVLHEVGEQKDWNESFYFNFYDRGNDLCGFMRIGLMPNKKEKSLFCFLMMPDGSLVGTKENVEMADNELRAKNLVFEKIEADKKWALRYEGELTMMDKGESKPVQVSFDLGFETLMEPYDYRRSVSGEKEKMSQAVASEHIEQAGKFSGTVKVGDKEYSVKGLGERDHSWGSRDWTAPRFWLWVTCQFNDGFAFNITKLEMDKGEIDAGFLLQDGAVVPIVKVDIAVERHSDDSPAELFMAFYDSDGNVYGTKGVTKKKALLKFEGEDKKHQAIMWETLTKFKIDDEVGYGIAEYLIRK